jgi:excinuclease ABC subunit A
MGRRRAGNSAPRPVAAAQPQEHRSRLPRDQLVVITGLSGSGKSSLAFDTIYAEGQRRYVESLSAYARQFLSMMDKPDVDHIEGLSPAISIEQKTTSHNPRSTVGTITEIYDYLRLLFARVGTPALPRARRAPRGPDRQPDGRRGPGAPEGSKLMLLAPVVSERKGEYPQAASASCNAQGFVRAASTARSSSWTTPPTWTPSASTHRGGGRPLQGSRRPAAAPGRIHRDRAASLRGHPAGRVDGRRTQSRETWSSAQLRLPDLRLQHRGARAALFSFNNPAGACPTCDGLGVEQFFDPEQGHRNPDLSASPRAPSAAGTGATATTSRCSARSASTFGFDLETPWKKLLTRSSGDRCCEGSGRRSTSSYFNDRGACKKQHPASRASSPTWSAATARPTPNAVREELARYISTAPCPDCGGTRLCARAHARVRRRHPARAHRAWPWATAWPGSRRSNCPASGRDRRQDHQGDRDRLRFLVDVGLNYLTWTAAPRPSPAARPSASASPARSAPAWWASCTSSTSPPSACTSATTSACSKTLTYCATSATR